jgi:hypothetical protein
MQWRRRIMGSMRDKEDARPDKGSPFQEVDIRRSELMRAILLCLLMLFSAAFPCAGQVVINELELSPPAGATMWVELFNAGNESVNLTGWEVKIADGAWTGRIYLDGQIEPEGYRVAEGEARWISSGNGSVMLTDISGRVIDVTPLLDDTGQSEFSYARIPNGRDTDTRKDFAFVMSSRGRPN